MASKQPGNALRDGLARTKELLGRVDQASLGCHAIKAICSLLGIFVLLPLVGFRDSEGGQKAGPEYTSDGRLKFPEPYREWVYLTSGFDMSYNPPASTDGNHVFDNVFVNPGAFKSFSETGRWPDKTILVLEVRGAQGKGSINQSGNYQSTEVMAVEVHVKDAGRFPQKWAFFAFDSGKVAKMIPQSADCYQCHAAHGAVDTTFVQFYPTLLPVAKSKNTLDRSYLKELASMKK